MMKPTSSKVSISLCGSMTDTETVEIMEILHDYFALLGYIVYTPNRINEDLKDIFEMDDTRCTTVMENTHLRSIFLSDQVLIVNTNYHIGESVLRELTYAITLQKEIIFYTQDQLLQDTVNKVKGMT